MDTIQEETMVKTVKCPRCQTVIEIQGKSGEKTMLSCSNCGVRRKLYLPYNPYTSKDPLRKTVTF
jgi:phage FluMu protein Com